MGPTALVTMTGFPPKSPMANNGLLLLTVWGPFRGLPSEE